jgi:hypothetical protein
MFVFDLTFESKHQEGKEDDGRLEIESLQKIN